MSLGVGRVYRYIAKFLTGPANELSVVCLQSAANRGYAPASDKLARLERKKLWEKLGETNYDYDDVEVNNYNKLSVQRMKEAEDKGISHSVSDWTEPELAISLYYKELKTSFVPKKFASLKKFVSFIDIKDMESASRRRN